jgi:hypothetical protein
MMLAAGNHGLTRAAPMPSEGGAVVSVGAGAWPAGGGGNVEIWSGVVVVPAIVVVVRLVVDVAGAVVAGGSVVSAGAAVVGGWVVAGASVVGGAVVGTTVTCAATGEAKANANTAPTPLLTAQCRQYWRHWAVKSPPFCG